MMFVGFITSYALTVSPRWLGALKKSEEGIRKKKTVLILGASSKTGLATAACIKSQNGSQVSIHAFGSQSSEYFVSNIGFFDYSHLYSAMTPELHKIVNSDEEITIVDLKGDPAHIDKLEELFGENIVDFIKIGVTDWRKVPAGGRTEKGRQFSVMNEMQVLVEERGEKEVNEEFEEAFMSFLEDGVPMRRGGEAVTKEEIAGEKAVIDGFGDILEGKVEGAKCLVCNL
jgi:NADPH:quinone reductase-like Zn-dependent oxidoreductase